MFYYICVNKENTMCVIDNKNQIKHYGKAFKSGI